MSTLNLQALQYLDLQRFPSREPNMTESTATYPDISMLSGNRNSCPNFTEVIPTAPSLEPATVLMTWEFVPGNPTCILGDCSAVMGDKAFIRFKSQVWQFSLTGSPTHWTSLTDHPLNSFALVIVENELVTVGGCEGDKKKFSNKLYSYIENKWTEKYPPMPTKRSRPAAVHYSDTVIVTGGENGSPLPTVEVLFTNRKQWNSVSLLPFATIQPSVSIFGEHIYLHPGSVRSNDGFSVVRCQVLRLLTSKSEPSIWEVTASLPVMSSSLATVKDFLLAFGGETKDVPSRDVFQYDPDTNSWQIVNRMSIARFQSATVVLPPGKVVVIGGNSGHESTEIATIL